jgi:outer membrane murein-binding lipoprotein Lpp
MIEELKEERNQKLEEVGKLQDRLAALESRMKEMKAEVERANMEAQINHEQGRKQYHEIA